MWAERDFTKILLLLNQLPRWSRFVEAYSSDEEEAEKYADLPESDKKEPYFPPLSHYTPEVEVLTNLLDAVQQLTIVTIAANSTKKSSIPKFVPSSRPRTALQRIRDRRKKAKSAERHKRLASALLGQ